MTAERKRKQQTNKQTTAQIQPVQVIQFTSGQARDRATDRVMIVHEFRQNFRLRLTIRLDTEH